MILNVVHQPIIGYDMNVKIFKNIKILRKIKSLTKEEMAYRMGISISEYCKIERGEVDLTITELPKIAAIFEVAVCDMLLMDITPLFN